MSHAIARSCMALTPPRVHRADVLVGAARRDGMSHAIARSCMALLVGAARREGMSHAIARSCSALTPLRARACRQVGARRDGEAARPRWPLRADGPWLNHAADCGVRVLACSSARAGVCARARLALISPRPHADTARCRPACVAFTMPETGRVSACGTHVRHLVPS